MVPGILRIIQTLISVESLHSQTNQMEILRKKKGKEKGDGFLLELDLRACSQADTAFEKVYQGFDARVLIPVT